MTWDRAVGGRDGATARACRGRSRGVRASLRGRTCRRSSAVAPGPGDAWGSAPLAGALAPCDLHAGGRVALEHRAQGRDRQLPDADAGHLAAQLLVVEQGRDAAPETVLVQLDEGGPHVAPGRQQAVTTAGLGRGGTHEDPRRAIGDLLTPAGSDSWHQPRVHLRCDRANVPGRRPSSHRRVVYRARFARGARRQPGMVCPR